MGINKMENLENIDMVEEITKKQKVDCKRHTVNIISNTLSIVILIITIISIILNVYLIQDVLKKNRSIRLNAYNYIDNLVEYEPTLITEISQILVNESVKAVEIETNGKYTGNRVDGKKIGEGTYEWNNGDKYEGEFKDDLMHGKGKLTIVGKGTYEGEFVRGKKSGEGTFKFINGDRYIGEWVDDKMQGSGQYTFANGDYYKGTFANNQFNGSGTYTKDGKSYAGTWKNNEYNK